MTPAAGPAVTTLTLVAGGRPHEREMAIAAALAPGVRTAVILEGLPSGDAALHDALAAALRAARSDFPFHPLRTASDASPGSPLDARRSAAPDLVRIAPGCLCCTGNLVLRVTLNRILRQRPAQLFIGLANPDHLGRLRLWLSGAPYDRLLRLGADLAPRQSP